MEHMEAEGETIDDAIENALNTLRVEREQVTVEILSDVKKGILGIGARKARVRVSLRRSIDIDQEPWEERQPPHQQINEGKRISRGGKGKGYIGRDPQADGGPGHDRGQTWRNRRRDRTRHPWR